MNNVCTKIFESPIPCLSRVKKKPLIDFLDQGQHETNRISTGRQIDGKISAKLSRKRGAD